MPSAYYRTDDPVENFKIRIGIREVSKSKYFSGDDGRKGPFVHDSVLSWQQKMYSPSDIADYLQNKESKFGSVTQFETRRHFSQLEQNGQNISELLDTDAMMYTYVNKDYFTNSSTPPVTQTEEYESFLGAAASSGGGGTGGRDVPGLLDMGLFARQKGLGGKLFRDKPYKSMHVCLATDIDRTALTAKPAWGLAVNHSAHFKEHILCSIRLYQDGLLEVSPSLSGLSEEVLLPDGQTHTTTGDASHVTALSPFMTDRTAEAAIRKGFLLATFRVRSERGDEYEYAVSNAHEVLVPHKIDDIMKAQSAQDAIRSGQNRGSSAGWKQDPPPLAKHKSITYYAEIVSATGFEGDRLYVNYKVKVPRGWELRVGDLSDGAANKDGTTTDGETDLNAKRGDVTTNKITSSLRGTTQTARVSDGPLGTSLRLSLLRPRFRGVRIAHAVSASQGTRCILGGALYVVTIIAFVLGAEYPFWIVPALAIVFSLGYGTHGGNVQTALLRSKHKTIAGSSLSQSQKGRSHSHRQREVVGSSGLARDAAVFNHPLSFSFDLTDGEDAAEDFSSVPPVIQLQVYSVGWFGRHKLAGYGYLTLSTCPSTGAVDCEVSTWKPLGGVRSKMDDFFLGNSVRLRDEDFADISSRGQGGALKKTVGAINKFGFLSETAGSLRLRCQVVRTDPRIVANRLQAQATAESSAALSGTQLKRTVQDILQTFKSTTGLQRSLAANSTASLRAVLAESQATTSGISTGSKKPSVSSIMDALNADSKASKVADILARARAKTAKSRRDAEDKKRAETEEALAPLNLKGAHPHGTPSPSPSLAGGIASSSAYDPHIEKPSSTTTAGDGSHQIMIDNHHLPPSAMTTPAAKERREAKQTRLEEKKGSHHRRGGDEAQAGETSTSSSRSRTPIAEGGGDVAEAKTGSGSKRRDLPALTGSAPRKGSGGSSARPTPRSLERSSVAEEEEEEEGQGEPRGEDTPLLSRQGSASGLESTEGEGMTRANLTRPQRKKTPPVQPHPHPQSHRYDNAEQDEEEEAELLVIKRAPPVSAELREQEALLMGEEKGEDKREE